MPMTTRLCNIEAWTFWSCWFFFSTVISFQSLATQVKPSETFTFDVLNAWRNVGQQLLSIHFVCYFFTRTGALPHKLILKQYLIPFIRHANQFTWKKMRSQFCTTWESTDELTNVLLEQWLDGEITNNILEYKLELFVFMTKGHFFV